MDVLEQLVQVGGLVERVNHLDDNLALGFHSLQIGDVQQANNDSGLIALRMAARFSVKPVPGSVKAAQTASHVHFVFQVGVQAAQDRAEQVEIIFMDEVGDGLSGEIRWRVTKHGVKSGV